MRVFTWIGCLILAAGWQLQTVRSVARLAADSTTNKREAAMEEIQEAKLAVVQFLRHIGADPPENFLATLPDPILDYDEVFGDFWELHVPTPGEISPLWSLDGQLSYLFFYIFHHVDAGS